MRRQRLLDRSGRLGVLRWQRWPARFWQRLSAFGFWQRRLWCGPRSSRCYRLRLTRDGWLAVYWRQRLSASAWQRLTGLGFRKSRFRRRSLRRRLCRRRRRRRLTDDGRLAVYWRQRLTGFGFRKSRLRRLSLRRRLCRRRRRRRLTGEGRLAVYWRQRLSASAWQWLTTFGFGKSRFRRLSLRRRLCRRRRRRRLTGDRRLAVCWRQRLSASAWQRLTGFGFRKSHLRRLPRSRRLCRRRSRRWLTGDRWLAGCRWRRSGLRLTGRRSVWRSRILNRNRFWSDRRRKRRCEQSGGASACNAGTYNSGAGRRRFRCRGRLRLRCRGLNWRGESLGLPTWIGNYNGIGGVIDDDSIVDVVVDDIVWRWRHVFWRVDPDRYRNIHRNRKNIRIHRRRWRSQIDEVNRPRRQEKHRRRRRRLKSEIRIVENQYRPFDVNHLFRRRRRHIVADDFESLRRFESGRQIRQPTPRIVGVGAAGVTT